VQGLSTICCPMKPALSNSIVIADLSVTNLVTELDHFPVQIERSSVRPGAQHFRTRIRADVVFAVGAS
jgi:hypothetical protein